MTKRMLSGILSVVICLLSMFAYPVNAINAIEFLNSGNESILLYDKMFLGLGDECEVELRIEVEEYYVFSFDYSIVSVIQEDSHYKIIGQSVGTATIYVNYYNQDGMLMTNTCVVKVFDEHEPISTEEFYLYLNSRDVLLSANPANSVFCIMNQLDVTNCTEFYNAIKDGQPPFCDDCMAYIEERIPQIIYPGNSQ